MSSKENILKVLWICNIPLLQVAKALSLPICNTGSWLVGLFDGLSKKDNIQLIVAFPLTGIKSTKKIKVENICYYIVPQSKNNPCKYDNGMEKSFEIIIKETNPDIIHIFGTEYPHTLAVVNASNKKNVVISIQGLVSVCEKHYVSGLPNNVQRRYTLRDLLKHDNILNQQKKFMIRGRYEVEAIKKVSNIIGRTTWDKACTMQINPDANYYFCNEILRNSFYNKRWDIRKCCRNSIFISQGQYPIKGLHFMLEAMGEILRQFPDTHIYVAGGNIITTATFKDRLKLSSYGKYISELIKKYNLQKHITFTGPLDEDKMCEQYLTSHVFVSPSSVENESNSLSEAKIIGVPSIASYVGGVVDRINHGHDGFLYQHDAVYMLVHYVCKVFKDDNLAIKISLNAQIAAKTINDKKTNLNNLLSIYNEVIYRNIKHDH